MEAIDFAIEYHSETHEFTDSLKAKVEQRLGKLARQHRDITGASLAIHRVSGANRHHQFRVRLVLYHKPDNIAATHKADAVANALMEALNAIERQVRERRDRRRESHRARKR
jgi:ribosomal subunit interface protein